MSGRSQPHLPLSGVIVLDLTLARAGPTCVRHLADWGADVIRVEPPSSGGEDVVGRRNGSDFQNLHRNKRAIQLNLKNAEVLNWIGISNDEQAKLKAAGAI